MAGTVDAIPSETVTVVPVGAAGWSIFNFLIARRILVAMRSAPLRSVPGRMTMNSSPP